MPVTCGCPECVDVARGASDGLTLQKTCQSCYERAAALRATRLGPAFTTFDGVSVTEAERIDRVFASLFAPDVLRGAYLALRVVRARGVCFEVSVAAWLASVLACAVPRFGLPEATYASLILLAPALRDPSLRARFERVYTLGGTHAANVLLASLAVTSHSGARALVRDDP